MTFHHPPSIFTNTYRFLPNTVAFSEAAKEKSPPPSPEAIKRTSSMVKLKSTISSLSLSSMNVKGAPLATVTPGTEKEDPFNSDSKRSSRLLTEGDARNVIHSDSGVPEWGSSTQLYNQLLSRAAPMPSRSVGNFSHLKDEVRAAQDPDFEPGRKKRTIQAPTDGAVPNYEKWTIQPALRGNGGLINAVRAALAETDVHVSWVGTLGFPTNALPEGVKVHIQDKLKNDYDSELVYVSDEDFAGHYANFCKTILWPIVHYQVADDVNSKAYMDHSWKYYHSVNRAFADQLIKTYKRDDTIWVHDYHLLLVPSMVREKLPDAKIGFFLHTAFPSSEVFRCQWKYKELLKGMLGANLVAFQLPEYAEHFQNACKRFFLADITSEGVQLEDGFVNVASQPIGINPAAIDAVRESEAFSKAVREIQKAHGGKQLIFGRDKADRVHGVRKKFEAYNRFLTQNPDRAKDTVLVQAITSPDESDQFVKVMQSYNKVYREHSSVTERPLEMFTNELSPAQYYAYLTVADVYMNSTQRDGMNLAPHEFIYCQDGKFHDKKHGAVILSEFAGSAAVLKNEMSDMLRINPWNARQGSSAISAALGMEADKKMAIWTTLNTKVMEDTGCRWLNELERLLHEAHKQQTDRSAASVPRLSVPGLVNVYEQAKQRCFILDYEGTLIAKQDGSVGSLTSPSRVTTIVSHLMKDPKDVVYVMDGQSHQQLEQIFQPVMGVGLIAENGCYILPHGGTGLPRWKLAISAMSAAEWKPNVRKILESFQERLEGSSIEELDCSFILRFDEVENQEIAERLAGSYVDQISDACKASGVRAKLAGKAIQVEPMDCDKSTMASTAFHHLYNQCAADGIDTPDFLMIAGNDREDECVFRLGNNMEKEGMVTNVFTVSISDRDTEAKAAITNGSPGLLSALQKLADCSQKGRDAVVKSLLKSPTTKSPVI